MKMTQFILRFVRSTIFAYTLAFSASSYAANPGNETVIRRYFAEWANRADVRAADELIATDLVMHHDEVASKGLDSFKKNMAGFHAAFPDVSFTVEDLVSDQGKVIVRWLMTGTQKGEFMGQSASGKSVRVTGMSLFRLNDGKIQEIWVSMDRLGFMQQLGLVSLPSAPPADAKR